MTQDEIIEFTKRSGLGMLLEVGGMDKCLEHFAKLVAESEREACAKIAEEQRYAMYISLTSYPPQNGTAVGIANLIRARGQA